MKERGSINLVMVLPFLKAGGTERQASYIANYLLEKGNNVTTLCVEDTGPFGPLFKVPIKYLDSKNSMARLFLNIFLFIRFLSGRNTDILISRAWNTNMLCSIVSKLTGIPAVLFLSGSIDLSQHSKVKRIVHRIILSRSQKIISVSETSKENCKEWLQIPDEKIKVIYNGVDIEMLQKKAEEHIDLPSGYNSDLQTIIFVGSLIHRKGLDVLLRAVANIIFTSEINLIVVGDGEKRTEYEELAKNLDIQSHVFFVGEKFNPFPYMKMGQIFVMPSRSEGFPNVLLEAMALKKAVIAANCETGPKEILNEKNGSLVPVEDVEALEKQIKNYLSDIEMRNRHAKEAQLTVFNDFSLQNQLSQFEGECRKIVNDK